MSGRSRRVPISFWHPPPRTHLWPFGSFARIDLRFAWQKNAGPLLAPALRGREQRVVWKRRSGGPSVNAKESFAPTLLLIHPSYAGCRSVLFRKDEVRDRKSVVSGKSVSVRVVISGRRIIKKKKKDT